jgi:nucleotide-binding universal stress UspA family protein
MLNPRVRSILVPTDFSDASVAAFAHALKLAVSLKAELDVFHVEPKNDTSDWHWAPGVVETLVRWGELPAGAGPADLEKLGLRARRTMSSGQAADRAILDEIASAHADLVVLATHGRSGVSAWLQPSVATPVAMTGGATLVLLLPPDVNGFISKDTGAGAVRRVLVPIDHRPHPAPGFDAAVLITRAVAADEVELATLHIGATAPETDLLRVPDGWTVHHWVEDGIVVDRIVARADAWEPDLVVLVTEGRRNWVDALRGSTVERLLARGLRCPVLIVPADWTGEV